jgi:hypothetical protein
LRATDPTGLADYEKYVKGSHSDSTPSTNGDVAKHFVLEAAKSSLRMLANFPVPYLSVYSSIQAASDGDTKTAVNHASQSGGPLTGAVAHVATGGDVKDVIPVVGDIRQIGRDLNAIKATTDPQVIGEKSFHILESSFNILATAVGIGSSLGRVATKLSSARAAEPVRAAPPPPPSAPARAVPVPAPAPAPAGPVSQPTPATPPKGKPGSYIPNRELPADKWGVPTPDVDAPHTQLGLSKPKYGSEPQAREWGIGSNGRLQPKRDIDFTDHNRPADHPSPHQHIYTPTNPKLAPKGGFHRGPPEAL